MREPVLLKHIHIRMDPTLAIQLRFCSQALGYRGLSDIVTLLAQRWVSWVHANRQADLNTWRQLAGDPLDIPTGAVADGPEGTTTVEHPYQPPEVRPSRSRPGVQIERRRLGWIWGDGVPISEQRLLTPPELAAEGLDDAHA